MFRKCNRNPCSTSTRQKNIKILGESLLIRKTDFFPKVSTSGAAVFLGEENYVILASATHNSIRESYLSLRVHQTSGPERAQSSRARMVDHLDDGTYWESNSAEQGEEPIPLFIAGLYDVAI